MELESVAEVRGRPEDVVDPLPVERAGPPDEPVDLIFRLGEQEFGEV